MREQPPPPSNSDTRPQRERCISSRELLGTNTSLTIRHNNEYYQLRLTRSGKLLLTK